MKRFRPIIYFLLLFMVGFSTTLSAQNKEFWFVIPDAARAHADNPVFFMITAGDRAATVVIDMPQNGSFVKQTKTLAANESWKVTYTSTTDVDLLENTIENSGNVSNKGIHITATNPISAYYQIDGSGQKEIFTLKGEKALGKEFYTPFQNKYAIASSTYQNQPCRQIHIVAADDNTVVYFKSKVVLLKNGGANFAANTYHSITLQKGQTLALRAVDATADLMGTHIYTTNNKRIAVTTYEDSVQSQGQDPIGDQIVPVNNVGTSYVVVKGYTTHNNSNAGIKNTVDHIYILATKPNTVVKMKKDASSALTIVGTIANAGDYLPIDIGDRNNDGLFRYIETTEPAYCFHQSAVIGEVGGALVPSMYAIASKKISFNNQGMMMNSIFLIYRESAKGSFKIKYGAANESDLDVQNLETGIQGWLYSRQTIDKTVGTTTISNADGAFAMGYFASPGGTEANPGGTTALYGYLSNFGDFTFGGDTIYHCGDSYRFDGGYAKTYKWTHPNNSISTTATINVNESGKYKVELDQDLQELVKDETYLKLQNFRGEYNFPMAAFVDQPMDFSIKINTTDWNNIYNVKYEWTFDGGASTPSVTMNQAGLKSDKKVEVPNVTWTTEGRKNIKVKITNLDANCEEIYETTIIVHEYPDNISFETCYLKPREQTFTIGQPTDYANAHTMSTPLVANLDGTGTKIIVPRMYGIANPWSSNGLVIIDAKNKTQYEITTTVFATHGQSIAIADVDKDDKCEIFIQGTDNKIYCYTPTGGAKSGFSPTVIPDGRYIVQIADLDNDGTPELVAGPYLYNAINGQCKKITFNADGTGYGNPHSMTNNNTGAYRMPAIGDIDGDGYLEIVAGSTVYKYDVAINDWIRIKVNTAGQPAAFKNYLDGPTVLVDFDLDGQLDVCVIGHKNTGGGISQFQFYVWNPRTQKVIAYAPDVANTSYGNPTIPYVGDLDNNGYPDFSFATTIPNVGMMSYQYDTNEPGNIKVGPTEGKFAETAGFTMFDFNQDGKAEIVYRGNSSFYIVDLNENKDGYVEMSTPTQAWSGTVAEYPIVADVDDDGQAEIILTRANQQWQSSNYNMTGVLSVYKSADPTKPWAPARSVWNQWNYNSIYINDDMTVPKFPLNPSTVFAGEDGIMGTTDDVRPYNGMLLQQTTLTKQGELMFLTPNVQIVDPQDVRFDYNVEANKMTISNLKIVNIGAAPLNAPIKITVYKDAAASGNTHYTHTYNVSLPINQPAITVPAFEVPNFKSFLPTDNLVIKVNDAGQGTNDQLACEECQPKNSDSFDNIPFDAIAKATPYKNCVGGTVAFTSENLPGLSITYKWLNPNNTQLAVTKNASKANLTVNDGGHYIFSAQGIKGDLSVTYKLPYLSVAPQRMYWKQQAGDHDWNNIDNWATDIAGTPIRAVPAPCTTVHIPGGANNYPSLDSQSTKRELYGDATVDTIVFHYNSELAYQHLLSYNRALIQYNFGKYDGTFGVQPTKSAYDGAALQVPVLKRNSWYTFAAPLKSMASGDFALAGYPLTWQAKHEIASLGNNGLVTVNNKSFGTNDVNLAKTYNAISIKVAGYNSSTIGYNNHRDLEGLNGIIQIPFFEDDKNSYRPGHIYDKYTKQSTFFYFNNKTLQQLHNPVGTMKRGEEAYRFVYENETTKAPDNITISGQPAVPGYKMSVTAPQGSDKKILIGNPFLASINAKKFIEANSLAVDESKGYLTYVNSTQTWETKAYTDNNNINSFQSFIITLKNNTADLYFPLEGKYALTGPTFKGNMPLKIDFSLYVRTTDNEGNGSEYAILSPENTSNMTNIEKLVSMETESASEVFFINGNDKKYNLVQLYKDGVKEIGLGVKSSVNNRDLTLNFDNIIEFALVNNVRPILIDKFKNVKRDLIVNTTYDFTQQGEIVGDQYIDTDRFVFRFNDYDNESLTDDGEIEIKYDNGNSNLNIDSYYKLDHICIYDMAGRQVFNSGKGLGLNIFGKYMPLSTGVYIVKVYTMEDKTKVEKIMVK